MKKLLIILGLTMLIILSGCGKKAEDRPAAKTNAPFSKGPSGPPVISAPNLPMPK
ncbi:hypothetical protein HYW83_02175 [Candidatus Peregrinibacteria bacterium]|nr:hypothetical protein [Candidatus Peregrinibacteria bacterium]